MNTPGTKSTFYINVDHVSLLLLRRQLEHIYAMPSASIPASLGDRQELLGVRLHYKDGAWSSPLRIHPEVLDLID